MNQRIGFACKLHNPPLELRELVTLKTTKTSWYKAASQADRFEKMYNIIVHNGNAIKELVSHVSGLTPLLRMCRIGSDALPLYTHECSTDFYNSDLGKEAIQKFTKSLSITGKIANDMQVRLSFHPGQFTVLNSITDKTVELSILEVEYHSLLAEMLGYSTWHERGMCINIHAGSKAGGLDKLIYTINNRLSQTARNLLTIENDEFSWGLNSLLDAMLPVPIVLDIHHHWIHTGEYITSDDPRWSKVIDGWRGAKPKIHVAMSGEELIVNKSQKPSLTECLITETRSSLRAHSQSAWSQPLITNALQFLPSADLMWEGKNKDEGSRQIAALID